MRSVNENIQPIDPMELLCAVRPRHEDEFQAAAKTAGVVARRIGVFVDEDPGIALAADGRREPLARGGWDHFQKWP